MIFMRQIIINYVNPAESNTLQDRYMDQYIYCFTFLKNPSYEVVKEKFFFSQIHQSNDSDFGDKKVC